MKLDITISKTRSGNQDYIQIISADMVSVNITLVAEEIEIKDMR